MAMSCWPRVRARPAVLDPGKVTYYAGGGAEEIIYNTSASPATVTASRFYPARDGTIVVRASSGTISY
jgi:hypothetical protein